MRIDEALKDADRTLELARLSEARREATSLLSFALDKPAAFLIAHPEYQLTPQEEQLFQGVLGRRERREPFQYITGRQEFWGLEFTVVPGVLIPRPETEILVEAAVAYLEKLESPSFLEAGVGTGCISISVLHSIRTATGIGTDISPVALGIAAQNARRHGIDDRLELLQANLLGGISGEFQLIVSNPPYIPGGEIDSLQPEVRDYEPRDALEGGPDGLDIIRRLVRDSGHILITGGVLMMEIGAGQAPAVADLFDSATWGKPEFRNDLQAIPRVVIAARR